LSTCRRARFRAVACSRCRIASRSASDATSASKYAALLTDYDAVRMYDSKLVEDVLGVKITDSPGPEPIPAQTV